MILDDLRGAAGVPDARSTNARSSATASNRPCSPRRWASTASGRSSTTRLTLVRAHERARDLPDLGRGQDRTHPHRPRRRVHALQLQPPGPGRRARRDARRPLGGRVDLGAGPRRDAAGDVAVRRRPRRTYAGGRGGAAHDRRHAWRERASSSGTASSSISPPRPILPRPVQIPHPPLFLACTKNDTLQLAAEYGHRRTGDRVRRPRRRPRDADDLRRGHRATRRRALRLDGGQRPLLRALPHHRPRRRRRGPAASAHGGSGSSPSRSRTGTAAARRRARSPSPRTTWPRSARRRTAWSRACTRRRSRCTPSTTATFNVDHAYGDCRDAIAYAERLGRPAPTRSCASSRWARCHRRPASRRSGNGAST